MAVQELLDSFPQSSEAAAASGAGGGAGAARSGSHERAASLLEEEGSLLSRIIALRRDGSDGGAKVEQEQATSVAAPCAACASRAKQAVGAGSANISGARAATQLASLRGQLRTANQELAAARSIIAEQEQMLREKLFSR